MSALVTSHGTNIPMWAVIRCTPDHVGTLLLICLLRVMVRQDSSYLHTEQNEIIERFSEALKLSVPMK